MTVVAHNMLAMNAQRQYRMITKNKAKSTEKLASGFRINRAADDAAGLTISEKMRKQIRGLNRASQNIQDGISLCQVADGALGEMESMIHRMNELSVQGANDTNTAQDREAIDAELRQLRQAVNDICSDTEFNGIKIFQDPYIPSVSGFNREIKVWNSGVSADGRMEYGGIEYGGKRYSWTELNGMTSTAVYDSVTEELIPGEHTVTLPAYEYDAADGYTPTGTNVSFGFVIAEDGKELQNITRNYSWSASAAGIIFEGRTYAWDELEDEEHNKTFDSDNIKAGNYAINTQDGTHIWFTIPDSARDLSDVMDGITMEAARVVAWTSKVSSVSQMKAVNLSMGGTVNITEANKGLISDQYTIVADRTGAGVVNGAGTSLAVETWSQLGMADADGTFNPQHGNTYHGYYNDGECDYDHNNTNGTSGWEYTQGTDQYQDARTGMTFQLSAVQEASQDAVIAGLDGVIVSTAILADTVGTMGSYVAAGNYVTNAQVVRSNISFELQRTLGRNFDSATADVGIGNVVEQADRLQIELTGAGGSEIFASNTSASNFRNQIKNCLESSAGGSISLELIHGDDSISLKYDVRNLTDTESTDLANGTSDIEGIVNDIMTTALGTANINANGLASQTYIANEKNMAAGNAASYVNFGTVVDVVERVINIQASDVPLDSFEIKLRPLNSSILGLDSLDVDGYTNASMSIHAVGDALSILNRERSRFGAMQNGLEHTRNNVENRSENLQTAESKLRDTDMASEMVKYSKNSILEQVGQAMIAQANQNSQMILQLLQ